MNTILHEPTRSTPMVRIDPFHGVIVMTGRSSPENAVKFYFPIIKKVHELFKDFTSFEVEIHFSYFNTSSSKCLFNFFKMLSILRNGGREIIINWSYDEDDEDMLEIGMDYSEILSLPFNFKVVE